jgi:hypothetical protein
MGEALQPLQDLLDILVGGASALFRFPFGCFQQLLGAALGLLQDGRVRQKPLGFLLGSVKDAFGFLFGFLKDALGFLTGGAQVTLALPLQLHRLSDFIGQRRPHPMQASQKLLLVHQAPSSDAFRRPHQLFQFRDGSVDVGNGYRLLSAAFRRSCSATKSGTNPLKSPSSKAISLTMLELR